MQPEFQKDVLSVHFGLLAACGADLSLELQSQ